MRTREIFRYFAVTAYFCLLYVEAASEGNYVFHFRRTEFIDGVLRRLPTDVDREVESLCRKMEVNCRFTKAMDEYEYLQKTAPGCATPRDRQNLENAMSSFQIAREECVNKADCKNALVQEVAKTVANIEDIDTAAYKEVVACGTDNSCKYNVYNNTHNNIFSLYLTSQPRLRMLQDKGVASDDCAGAVVNCMVARNEAALRSMYEGAARLRECQEGAGVGAPASS